jgi:hypothetical protein
MNYVSLGVALLALILLVLPCFLPYWTIFPRDDYLGWPQRQWGLLKVSGKYTQTIITPADIAWLDMRDTTCQASAVWTGTGGAGGASMASNGLAMASALGNAASGVTCAPMCKNQISTRCLKYYSAVTINFVVLGLLVAGPLVSLVGAGMPLIGKERKKDRTTWLLLEVVGFLLAAAGCAVYFFITTATIDLFRQTSYYPKSSLGWCFYMACAGAVLLIVPAILQMVKIFSAQDKKTAADSAQLLTAGASPDFLMPTAI